METTWKEVADKVSIPYLLRKRKWSLREPLLLLICLVLLCGEEGGSVQNDPVLTTCGSPAAASFSATAAIPCSSGAGRGDGFPLKQVRR